ncbi:MAG: DNA polymerase III subunit beta [Actinomycetota bacterium]|nr:DNA polymerase III subunit beta [Actinomycetota bacterium]
MKLMVSAKPFTAELKSVLPAVANRPGLPMLSGVRLEASEGEVAIEATDLELTARRVVRGEVTVDGAGSVVVPAKALVKAIAAMGEPEIVLESDSSDGRAGLDVRAGTRTVTLQGWPTDDWPAVPQVAAIDPIASIDASAARDAFERVALCASDDESRPVLTCVALYFGEDPPALEVVSTDSYRLGVARLPLEAGFRVSDGPLLVPARGIRLLAKQLKGAEGAVQVRALEASGVEPSRASRIAFSFPDAEWTVRTVEGEFPNWKQVVPEPEGGSFEFDPEELGTALRAATSVRSKGAPVRLTLDRTCSLALKDPDLGEMREALTAAKFSPNGAGAMEVAFNPDYLADAIRFCGAERGRMSVRDGLKPVLFEGPDRRYALMPIRLP